MKEEQLSNDELQLFKRRDLIIKGALAVPVGGILWRLWDLQIKQGEKYKELAKGNRIRLNSVAAPRGIIYDVNGVILAKNIPSFNLMLVKEDTPDKEAVLAKLSRALKIPVSIMQRALESKARVAKYQPLMIYKDLTWYQMALVSAYQEEFPGISIEVSPRRFFPLVKSGAHVIGYMNQITKAQLRKLPEKQLMSARVIGQEGVERIYNDVLIGTDGGEQVEVDSTGRVIRRMDSIDPLPGKDLQLNVDSRLQRKIEELLGDKNGSIVMMDPQNGTVKAMVSKPAFDPNVFSQGISSERWNELINDPDHVLHNKCIQGIYSPGSTFKMAVAAAGLESGVIDESTEILCEGHYRYGRTLVHCWNRAGHGPLNVFGAIENSCNVFFYKMAMEVGVDKINEYARRFGFARQTGIDLHNEQAGLIPSKAWKQRRFGEPWYPGETLPVSIGQGFVSVTPLQMARYASAIGNGGWLVKPRLALRVLGTNGEEDTRFQLEREKIDISDLTIKTLQRGMFRNVHGAKGTGRAARSVYYKTAGKTGTTQVVSHKTRARLRAEEGEVDSRYFNHAWFVGYAPYDNPKVAVSFLLENGRSGTHAAAMAREVLEYYFSEIDPLPSMNPEQDESFIEPI
ncbi:MAG: penicillin-binding protein 2 [bacterium]|nr:penicillin-binding protein 2 [bacterium]